MFRAGAPDVAGLAVGCTGGEQSEATEVAGTEGTTGGETGTETAMQTETETVESTTYVTSTVENAGEENIESVEVSVTLYDAEDRELFDFRNTVEEEEGVQRLALGESWNFRVRFADIDMQRIARYVVSADSDLV